MDHEIHGSDIVVVDEHAIERLELGFFFLFLEDLNFRDNFDIHG
jgi:hypothetical protein